MTERIDHADVAMRILNHGTIVSAETEALAHATLALVEQQRISNLIALHRHEVEYDINEGRSLLFEAGSEALNPNIAAALGIEEVQS